MPTPNPLIVPHHAFGINGPTRDNIVTYRGERKDSDNVISSVANHVVSIDSETRSTRFFEQSQQQGAITALCISRNGKILAASFRASSGDGAQIIVYRTSSRKCIANLMHKSKVKSMCFSGNSKELIVAAEDSLNVWAWESQKLEFSSAFTGNITRVSCPLDQFSPSSLFVTSTGMGFCRLWLASTRHRMANLMIMPVAEQKYDYRDHVWLPNLDPSSSTQHLYLAVVTQPLLKDDNGMFNIPCPEETTINIFTVSEGISSSRPRVELSQSVKTDAQNGTQIMCIAAMKGSPSPGFALGCSNGVVLLFHQNDCDSKLKFANTRRVVANEEGHGAIITIQNRTSKHEDTLLICSDRNRIYELDVRELQDHDCSCVEFLTDAGHLGGVEDMDCSIDKPNLVSCGKDKVIRIWDLEQQKCIVSHDNGIDEPQSVAIHPGGFQVAVGYKDKLVLYYVLFDRLKVYREMQCRSAVRLLRFSEGGQYLAVACGNIISVYCIYQKKNPSTFVLMSSFIGHVGAIKHLSWAGNTIFSSGLDRNIYGWDMKNGARIDNLNVLRSFGACESLVVKTAARSSFKAAACTSDGKLHTLEWSGKLGDESKVTTLINASEEKITSVCITDDDAFLLGGTSGGSIHVYQWDSEMSKSLHSKDTPKEQNHLTSIYQVSLHCSNPNSKSRAITSLLSKGDQILSGGGIDGAILISNFRSHGHLRPTMTNNRDVGGQIMAGHLPGDGSSNIVLIGMDELESTKELITVLQERIKSMKSDHQFSSHSMETMWKNELMELTQKTDEVVEAERQRYDELQNKYDQAIQSHVKDLDQRDKKYKDKIQEAEETHDKRLSEELDRQEILGKEMKAAQENFDRKTQELKNECHDNVIEIQQNANAEVRRLKSQLNKLQEENIESEKVFREILDQQEEEYEMELLKLKSASTLKVHQEKTQTQEIKNVVTQLKSKKNQLVRQNDELRSKASFSEDSLKVESATRRKLQNEINEMKSKIGELENTLHTKDNQIKVLESQAKSSMSLKLLLETQVNDLKLEKVPLHAEISQAEKQISSLSNQLKKEKNLVQLRESERNQVKDRLSCQMRRIKQLEGEVRAMKRDFVLLGGLDDEVEVKKKIDSLYKQHVRIPKTS